MQIEQGHKEGLKAAAEFCGIKDYEPEDMNLSNRFIFHFSACYIFGVIFQLEFILLSMK